MTYPVTAAAMMMNRITENAVSSSLEKVDVNFSMPQIYEHSKKKDVAFIRKSIAFVLFRCSFRGESYM